VADWPAHLHVCNAFNVFVAFCPLLKLVNQRADARPDFAKIFVHVLAEEFVLLAGQDDLFQILGRLGVGEEGGGVGRGRKKRRLRGSLVFENNASPLPAPPDCFQCP
jgi:hypothetical protein